MAHRDDFPRFSARSVRRSDAQHRKACATLSESLGKPPFRSRMRPVGGRRKALPMRCIAGGILLPDGPHTRSLWVIITDPWYKAISQAYRKIN